jgi:iron complex outermembrane receptor protein
MRPRGGPSNGEETMSARLTTALCATAAVFVLAGSARQAAAQSDQPAAAARSGMEEIVVTARRREERLQTVPIAITAFTQAELEQKHVEQMRDLSKVVPSLAVSQTLSDANAFFSGQVRLRGLAGTEIYFADVPLSSTDSNPATGLTHGLSPGFFYDNDRPRWTRAPRVRCSGGPRSAA